jgi:hypothetical protein
MTEQFALAALLCSGATGRYIDYNWKKMTPLSNLYVEMLNRSGVPTTRFGDSTGGLAHLA